MDVVVTRDAMELADVAAGVFRNRVRTRPSLAMCPPAPPDGYFWRQVRTELLAWANVDVARSHRFTVDAADLTATCAAYEAAIADAGGLDVVMLGLGPNAHLASNEPGTAFDVPASILQEHPRCLVLTDRSARP